MKEMYRVEKLFGGFYAYEGEVETTRELASLMQASPAKTRIAAEKIGHGSWTMMDGGKYRVRKVGGN